MRPSTGPFGWIFARHTSDASTDARWFAIDARRLPSATRDLRRSRGETFATNLRCLFPAESASQARGLRPLLRTPRESVRESTPAMDDASPISATRAPRFPTLALRASGRGPVVPAPRARTQLTGRDLSSGVVHREPRRQTARRGERCLFKDSRLTDSVIERSIDVESGKIMLYLRPPVSRQSFFPSEHGSQIIRSAFSARRFRSPHETQTRRRPSPTLAVAQTTVSQTTLAFCLAASRRPLLRWRRRR